MAIGKGRRRRVALHSGDVRRSEVENGAGAVEAAPHDAVKDEEFRRVALWLDCQSPELGAYTDVAAQKGRGKLGVAGR